MTIDLGSGNDQLTLAAATTNTVTISNIETLIGSAGNDSVALAIGITGGAFDLVAGNDRLMLANAATNTRLRRQHRDDHRRHRR